METNDNLEPERNKLLSHYWDLNSDSYRDQISFNWKNNEIRIDIHSFCNPPGNEKSVHFNFFINGEHTLYKLFYSCYGVGTRGTPPHLLSENYLLAFHLNPNSLEVYQERIINEFENVDLKNRVNVQRKDLWISVYDGYRSGMRCDSPFKDSNIKLWIKKSYNYKHSFKGLMFKYELYSANLFFISPKMGNFTCCQIFDHYKSTCCGDYLNIGCEISDGNGEYRKFYWDRRGLEDLTIFEIIRFFQSLRCFFDWRDYDHLQESYKTHGLSDSKIDKLLTNEIRDLGIVIDLE